MEHLVITPLGSLVCIEAGNGVILMAGDRLCPAYVLCCVFHAAQHAAHGMMLLRGEGSLD